jgi:hypothetical protein
MSALKELRRSWDPKNGPQLLWIDAIYINQGSDSDEKAIQVGIMDQIFQRASKTIAWLGEKGPETAEAMQLLKSITRIDID